MPLNLLAQIDSGEIALAAATHISTSYSCHRPPLLVRENGTVQSDLRVVVLELRDDRLQFALDVLFAVAVEKVAEQAPTQVAASHVPVGNRERQVHVVFHHDASGCTTVAPLQIIQSADVRQRSDVDSADLVEEINGKRRKFAVWYLPLVLLCVLWFNVLSASATPNPLWIEALGVLSVAVVASSYCGCTCGTKPAAARFSSTISTIARSGHMSVSWMASLR